MYRLPELGEGCSQGLGMAPNLGVLGARQQSPLLVVAGEWGLVGVWLTHFVGESSIEEIRAPPDFGGQSLVDCWSWTSEPWLWGHPRVEAPET